MINSTSGTSVQIAAGCGFLATPLERLNSMVC